MNSVGDIEGNFGSARQCCGWRSISQTLSKNWREMNIVQR